MRNIRSLVLADCVLVLSKPVKIVKLYFGNKKNELSLIDLNVYDLIVIKIKWHKLP